MNAGQNRSWGNLFGLPARSVLETPGVCAEVALVAD
jgi:hypothetical protein